MNDANSAAKDFLSLEKGEASERTEQSGKQALQPTGRVPVFYLTRIGFRIPVAVVRPSGPRWSVLRFAPLSRISAKHDEQNEK